MDPNAGKYHKLYADEFAKAKEALRPYGGELAPGKADYEAFVYKSDSVRLVFYPHKTSAWNYHIRVRDQGSKDQARLTEILGALRIAGGNCCTFSVKNKWVEQVRAADRLKEKRNV